MKSPVVSYKEDRSSSLQVDTASDQPPQSVTAKESSLSSRKSGRIKKQRKSPKSYIQTENFQLQIITKDGQEPRLVIRKSDTENSKREDTKLTRSVSGSSILSSLSSSLRTSSLSSTTRSEAGLWVWANKAELLLSLVALTIGYANVWLFPYMVIKYSIVFLLPYFLFQILLGFPLVYMELALGQFSNYRPPDVFANMAPLFKGLGWAMILVDIIKTPHYNIITAWVAYFLFDSFILPWKHCNEQWNTINCTSIAEDDNCRQRLGSEFFYSRQVSFNQHCTNDTLLKAARTQDVARKLSSYEFFYYRMYNTEDTDTTGLGDVQWQLVLCLLLCWTLVLICVWRSIRSFGIVVYFTTGLPLCALVVLAIYGTQLDNADEGIRFLLRANWTNLRDPYIWAKAGALVTYTSSSAFGVLITLASFNKFRNNCFYDALFVVGINVAVSLICCFSVFCVLGSLAAHYGISPIQAARVGSNVALIIYAEALSRDKFGAVFCFLFYLFLLCIGLDTVFIDVECIISSVCDQWPVLHRCRWAVATTFCTVFFLVGLPMCSERGFLLFNVFKKYSYAYSVLCLALLEVVCVVYVYGYAEFISNIRSMLGAPRCKTTEWIGPTGYIMLVLWGIATSSILFMLIVFSFMYTEPIPKSARTDYSLPKWMELIGWLQVFSPLAIVVLFGAAGIVKQLLNRRALSQLLKPTNLWCPTLQRSKDSGSVETLLQPIDTIMKLAEYFKTQRKKAGFY